MQATRVGVSGAQDRKRGHRHKAAAVGKALQQLSAKRDVNKVQATRSSLLGNPSPVGRRDNELADWLKPASVTSEESLSWVPAHARDDGQAEAATQPHRRSSEKEESKARAACSVRHCPSSISHPPAPADSPRCQVRRPTEQAGKGARRAFCLQCPIFNWEAACTRCFF
ncbi:unnamed protein product [Pleuronectes platessa]|uniref:Uncharacterized protein n=1 Tax=Pleuronectes platessa TaxID=8262 RepID=A0A9N7YYB0_PLEPL|nr:unnamed protein product [Pleuronectes platessa]